MKKLIVSLTFLLSTFVCFSQLNLDLAATKTDLKNNAITVGISYLRSLDSVYGGTEFFVPGKRSFFMITPDVDIVTGTEDAFSSIVIKASGLFNTFKTTEVAGLITPDYNKTFHTFPASLGFEANNLFNNINGILEVGWVPYYQSYGRSSPDWVKKTSFGLFLQAGYKFTSDSVGIGGEVYEGEEKEESGIARVRGTFKVDTDKLLKLEGMNIGLIGTADGWGDAVNSAFYYKVEGRARVFLTDQLFLDFIISKGSGAPLFNEAEQFGIGVSMDF